MSLSPSQTVLQYFSHSHLPAPLQAVVKPIATLAVEMEHAIPDGPEKTMGLRKLLEAKDCLVRGMLSPEKPWWQTSDLDEVLADAQVAKVTEGNLLDKTVERVASGIPEVASNPEPGVKASQNTATTEERMVARSKAVIDGECHGPIVVRDNDEGSEHLAECFWGFCDWAYAYLGDQDLKVVQSKHDGAGKLTGF